MYTEPNQASNIMHTYRIWKDQPGFEPGSWFDEPMLYQLSYWSVVMRCVAWNTVFSFIWKPKTIVMLIIFLIFRQMPKLHINLKKVTFVKKMMASLLPYNSHLLSSPILMGCPNIRLKSFVSVPLWKLKWWPHVLDAI